MTTLEELIDAQEADCDSIARSFTNCKKKAGQRSKGSLTSFLQALEQKWSKIQTVHRTILKNKKDAHAELPYFKEDYYVECEDAFLIERGKYLDALDALAEAAAANDPPPAEVNGQIARPSKRHLPPISLPTFSGKYMDWPSFKDYFGALVRTNEDLRTVEKLHYLKSSISGDAANLIKNIPVTGDNYTRVWETLESYYDSKRNLIRQCLNALFQLQPITSEAYTALKQLRDGTHDAIETLKALDRPVDQMDDLLVHMTVQKLDPTTRRDWELSLGSAKTPTTWRELSTFLDTRIQALENTAPSKPESSPKKPHAATKSSKSQHISAHTASKARPLACALCQKDHSISFCETFKTFSVDNKYKLISEKQLCLNCLRPHPVAACRSTFNCKVCQERHHTLLHRDSKGTTAQPSSTSPSPPNTTAAAPSPSDQRAGVSAHTTNATIPQPRSILLATARFFIVTEHQRRDMIRALIDPCSEASFITESLAQRLRLPRQSTFVPVLGVGGAQSYTAKSAAVVEISSRFDDAQRLKVRTLIMPKLTEYLPPSQAVNSSLSFVEDLCLADSQIHSSDRIEMILGADAFTRIIHEGLRRSPDGDLIAQSTILGWILTGAMPVVQGNSIPAITSLQCICDTNLSTLLEDFWQQEEPSAPQPVPFTAEELECDNHFLNTHQRDGNGRYVLRLPIKGNVAQLGDSRPSALNLLLRTEQRFHRLPQLKKQYVEFLGDYQDRGHMKQAPLNCSPPRAFFLPHHGVFKAHGDTSKLRVVFNGSVKLSSGLTLNDCLHAGPKLQLDIFDVLLAWRKHKVVFTADIKQMFRQIRIHAEDQPLQQILWRTSEEQPILSFYLGTVTYGLASSPYQAIRTLLQLALDEEHRFPRASDILRKSRYVDDILVGADSIPEALELKDELIQLLKAGGFPLSKWTSNNVDILSTVPPADRATAEMKTWPQLEDSDVFRTLGVSWQPNEDIFKFNFETSSEDQPPTKRSVLSLTAQLYDPVGWIVPFTVSFKIFMQMLWHTGLQWDDPLPRHLQDRWRELARQLPQLEHISVPRWLGYSKDVHHIELHGFSDASERAYAACVYLRCIDACGDVTSALISSKSKVAPLKQVSLPRLELCGALILVRLTKRIQEALSVQSAACHLWSDSTITLAWIREHPSNWKTYIANRVSEIQTTLPQATWHHVPGKNNPADLASRGVSARELAESSLWFNGPSFLAETSEAWASTLDAPQNIECPERRATTCLTTYAQRNVPPIESDFIKRFSVLKNLLKTTAWCLHFIAQLRRKRNPSSLRALPASALTPTQLNDALNHWVHYVQRLHYGAELASLQTSHSLPTKSTLVKLHPLVDESNTLRVGGRLRHALLHPDEIHPIILPRESHLTRLLVADAHAKTLHGGVQLTLNVLRQRFWIVRGRQLVKSFISHCHRCWRHRAMPTTQLMGDLPLERVRRSRAFLHTGVDYAGPISMRLSKGRGTKSYKGYISVFICLATRAVHLEAVSGYSTADFLLAFRRFIARRGHCALLVSDCGTNFVGADKELRTLFQQASAQSVEIANQLAEDGTEWRFNPPAAPHFGGIWEAAVKSVKFHLKRVIGETLLTFEEMSTLLAQIEACLNSRPLMPLTDDASDLSALTPGHFLIGSPPIAVPEPSLQPIPMSRLSRWQLLQRMHEHFWARWSQEYLHSLQQRPKWKTELPPISVGDLCLLRSDNLPPCKWPLARITKIHPGPDGLTRVATIKTASTTLVRPIVKLSLLPKGSEDN